jgi:nucleoside-diphosphate-sugar epimerase
VSQLALITKQVVEKEFPERASINIETTTSNDNRSYHVSSRKIGEKLGFRPDHTIEDAVRDLCAAFKAGKFKDSMTNDNYVNVKAVKRLGLQ